MKTLAALVIVVAVCLCAVPCLAREADALFRRLDRNGDGKLTRDEMPDRLKRMFGRVDANKDGTITLKEHQAFRARRGRRPGGRLPQPDHASVKYGPHARNVFDLWLAKSEGPTPLVIYYHGGGFRAGDKRTINRELLKRLLAKGVSVAAANYRLSDAAPFPAQMHDSARALQHLRHHAKKYNLDPTRVGATGGSAGAGISLWLAFHEDLADAKSADPVARQSTRLSAAVVYAGQSSYDPRFIHKLFDTKQIHPALISFFGMKTAADAADAKFHPLFEEASAINHATAGDPPVMLYYPQANRPLRANSSGGRHIHHPKFGIVLKEKLDKLGVECVVLFRKDHPRAPVAKYVQFFLAKLKVAAPAEPAPAQP